MRGRRPLAGQVVVITGAARGIGAELADLLSGRGARLALVGLEPDQLARVARDLPGEAAHWAADVTDADAMRRVADAVRARFGRVDTVVANAGVATGGLFAESDEAVWRRVIEVNLLGSAATCRAFLPTLRSSAGYYLQIASFAALTPAPLMTAYCASKSGVEAFAHSLRAEVAGDGVRVGVGYLSWTDTDMVRGADEDQQLAAMRRRLPWPANRTYPLAPAVARLAAGIERRATHVYAQRWLRSAVPVRGALPAVVGGRLAQRRLRALGPGAGHRGLVGPGGRAAGPAR
ncbi:SDR family NAD(P)-dependent oxidoreductase [Streptomyces sp. 3MP-14]|uniref:SDR family NAD(P)-dependent oxidoreductase n=1 Tax=Streptomyces mimosae TaxID=2586635 RepID=A0A5N6A8V0_9ACTN|nr:MULTISPECIES: SDR family oxidoreductase [Streptomyces]KAB8164376.1 SDR family NAD(P)-dependent oxidoreductase [Streptomyces mimosae]KAB8176741.1 SDR family NAD(P)-dependent oxidoreductase [Streptomyces sp. 3MP-14]